jgi:hypothetical protein
VNSAFKTVIAENPQGCGKIDTVTRVVTNVAHLTKPGVVAFE